MFLPVLQPHGHRRGGFTLIEVLVVVAPAPPPDPEAGSHKAATPSRGLGVYR